ncbi:MAG: ATP-binding protein [Pyrinomonadaceae bacterium]
MADFHHKKILAELSAKDFIGRDRELERILLHAKNGGGLLLSSAPGAGATELLKQVYDRLFSEASNLIPFYFPLDKKDKTARQMANRFVQQFLLQTAAFRRRDPKILMISPGIMELAELAIPSDIKWVESIVENLNRDGDDLSFFRGALYAPSRAAAGGAKVFVMIDDLHLSGQFEGTDISAEIQDILARSGVPFVLAGLRRNVSNPDTFQSLDLHSFPFDSASEFTASRAAAFGVQVNDQTRDLIAAKFGGNVKSINSFLHAAQLKSAGLDSFQYVERFYADELFGGSFLRFYDRIFREIAPNIEAEKNLIAVLHDAINFGNEKIEAKTWRKRLNLDDLEFARILDLLNIYEIVRVSFNRIEVMMENEVLTDYVNIRFRLESSGENRALVLGESILEYLKRAPQTMARLYRSNSATGLHDLMTVFAGQIIPSAVIDYGKFTAIYKGSPDSDVLRDLRSAADTIDLPRIVFAANAADIYKSSETFPENERSAVAFGFQEKKYNDEDEIVWIAAEIDSKLETARELTESWCERLETAASACNFRNFKIWLIAPEGFSPEALMVLGERNAFGSSRKQVELLKELLKTGMDTAKDPERHEYEIVVPMGGEAELIAAHTVEEIAKRHNFGSKAINQIKTALVEACINASEHSLSPDRKIYQKFSVDNERIVITVSNRGLRLADKTPAENEAGEERRGWGLKLMQKLMDEVKIEQTDDGTSISMTKYLKRAEQMSA